MNILFIGGAGNSPDANSVCVKNMANEFTKQGHSVWIMAMGDSFVNKPGTLGNAVLWEIPMDYYRRLTGRVENGGSKLLQIWFKLVSVIRHILLLFFYPVTSPGRSRKVAKKAMRIVKENHIDIVVCVFTPFDSIYAGMNLKKILGSRIKVVSYHLDLRTASINPNPLVRNYIHKYALRSIVEENRIVDKMLIPYSGQKEMEKLEGVEVSKIYYVGFPVYIEDNSTEDYSTPFDPETINVCYIGTLSQDNRNPRYILTLVEKINDLYKKNMVLHFWGEVGGLVPMLEASPAAVYHGKVENQYTRSIMQQADFLLNIGNAIAYDMLPSKVFGMFATGKPIINVITHPQDATLPFFERYNHSIDIKEYLQESSAAEELASGITRLQNTPNKVGESLFEDFKPLSICNIIAK